MQWIELEKQARIELRPSLHGHLRLARLTHRLVEAAIRVAAPDNSTRLAHSAEVQIRLLVKISRDLRVIELAAVNSYALQALGLAATVYELAHAVAYIGTDDERAREWEDHEDPSWSYPIKSRKARRAAVRSMIEAYVSDVSEIEDRIDAQEEIYQVFCMAKHGNPKALRRFGLEIDGTRVRLYTGPFVAPYVVRQARFALLNSAWLTAGAAAIMAQPFLERGERRARKRYNRLDRTVGGLILRLRDNDRAARAAARRE